MYVFWRERGPRRHGIVADLAGKQRRLVRLKPDAFNTPQELVACCSFAALARAIRCAALRQRSPQKRLVERCGSSLARQPGPAQRGLA